MQIFRKILLNYYWLLALLIIIAFYPVAGYLHPMKWDILDQFYACRYLLSQSFDAGFVPLWCPYINLGYPFFADPQAGIHYPISWLIALLFGYSIFTIQLEFLLHLFIAGVGMYKTVYLLSSHQKTAFITAVLFSLCGIFVSNAQHLTWLISIAWLSFSVFYFLLLFRDGNWLTALKLGTTLSLSLLGGYPAFGIIAFYLFGLFFCYYIFKVAKQDRLQIIGLFIGSGAVFLLLSANYLYSLATVMPHMARSSGLSADQVNINGFTLRCFISFIAPAATVADADFFNTDISMRNLYLGLLFLPVLCYQIFCIKNIKVNYLLLLSLLLLGAAVGAELPIRKVFYYLLPGMKLFKMAAIFRAFAGFFLLLIFSFGIRNILNKVKLTAFTKIGIGYWFFLLAFAVASYSTSYYPASIKQAIVAQLFVSLVFLTILLVLLYFFSESKGFGWILLLLISVEMISSDWKNMGATVVDATTTCVSLQSRLDSYPNGFEAVPTQNINSYGSVGDGSLSPIWQNVSYYKKTPAFDGFNNFQLQQTTLFTQTAIAHPLIFTKDSFNKVQITHFSPNEVRATVNLLSADTVFLLQNNFAGWQAEVNGESKAVNPNKMTPAIDLTKGKYDIAFCYTNNKAKYGLIISFIIFCAIAGLVALFSIFQHYAKNLNF